MKTTKKLYHLLQIAPLAVCSLLFSCMADIQPAAIESFESFSMQPGIWYNQDRQGTFSNSYYTKEVTFDNVYFNTAFESSSGAWYGWAVANYTSESSAYYSSAPGGGANFSKSYLIGNLYSPSRSQLTFKATNGVVLSSVDVTNIYKCYSLMKNGGIDVNKFVKDDYLKLTITGIDTNGKTGKSVEYYLADGTSIVGRWERVDLSSLGRVKAIKFSLQSSSWNLPLFFALDEIRISEK